MKNILGQSRMRAALVLVVSTVALSACHYHGYGHPGGYGGGHHGGYVKGGYGKPGHYHSGYRRGPGFRQGGHY